MELTVIGCKLCLPHGKFGYRFREQETGKSPDVFLKEQNMLDIRVHARNPISQKVEAGGSGLQGHPLLNQDLKGILG